ncbi:MAG: tetratricopeptide repeat protein, partial [Deltaproteobacteria bacterium]
MAFSADELEQRAERAVRRGELLLALELFESLLADNPEDERVRQRMESVRALLQPSELVNRRRAEPDAPEQAAPEALSDAEHGEIHASAGRFEEATRWYEKAVEKNPGNELLRERLEELRSFAPPGARADLAAAEKLEAPPSPPRPVPRQQLGRSARAAEASFAPLDERPKAREPLPRD